MVIILSLFNPHKITNTILFYSGPILITLLGVLASDGFGVSSRDISRLTRANIFLVAPTNISQDKRRSLFIVILYFITRLDNFNSHIQRIGADTNQHGLYLFMLHELIETARILQVQPLLDCVALTATRIIRTPVRVMLLSIISQTLHGPLIGAMPGAQGIRSQHTQDHGDKHGTPITVFLDSLTNVGSVACLAKTYLALVKDHVVIKDGLRTPPHLLVLLKLLHGAPVLPHTHDAVPADQLLIMGVVIGRRIIRDDRGNYNLARDIPNRNILGIADTIQLLLPLLNVGTEQVVLKVLVVQLNKERIILVVVLLQVKLDLSLVEHIAWAHIRGHQRAANPHHHAAVMGSVTQPAHGHVGHSVTYFLPSGVSDILAKLANIPDGSNSAKSLHACNPSYIINEIVCNIQAAFKSLIHGTCGNNVDNHDSSGSSWRYLGDVRADQWVKHHHL